MLSTRTAASTRPASLTCTLTHKKWGSRWIDCKQPKHYSFTRAQKQKWPLWESFRIGIWILTAGTQEEYDKLFQLPNWRSYWKAAVGDIPTQADIDTMLDELVREEQERAAKREDGSV